MNNPELLAKFKKRIDIELEDFFVNIGRQVGKVDFFMDEALRHLRKMALAGGKRLRPAFMYYGYLAAGGREREKMLRTSISVELVHIFLLIHDDIMDRDDTRHGLATIHHHYAKIGRRLFPGSDHEHFGKSMGIIIGDMVGALGNQVIYDSKFDSKYIMRALSKLQGIVAVTALGQEQDFVISHRKKATEQEILEMYKNKTAKYSVEGPLHLGAILGGAGQKLLDDLSAYAIPLGIAFQIQDDILGIFGSEKKLGKSVGSDITEGKRTLLVIKALEKADGRQKKILQATLGKQNLSAKDIADFQRVITETGALRYAQKMSGDLVAKAKYQLEKMKIEAEAKEFLYGIAEYLIKREF